MTIVTNTTTPTQVAEPWKATLRTALQTVAGVLLGLVSFVAGAAVLAPQFLDAIQAILPPEWAGYAAGAVAFIGTLAGVFARIMAIPGVNDYLTKLKLGASAAPTAKHKI
jgi:cbb3-type cytochrome oxidase subunit 1